MILEIIKAEYVSEYKIKLWFNNGECKTVDLQQSIFSDHRVIFQALRDVNYFKSFQLIFDTIGWNNGLDLAPEFLYDLSLTNQLVNS